MLRNLFEQYGEVTSVKIITDKVSGRSKGFAFVEMATMTKPKKPLKILRQGISAAVELTVNS